MAPFFVRLRKHWLIWQTGLVIIVAAMLTGLIISGRFDPQPIGQLKASWSLSGQSVEAGQQQVVWLDNTALAADFSLKLTAAFQAGEQDIGYGLLVGQPDKYLGITVSPLGYVTIWQVGEPEIDAIHRRLMPWQTWPHVRLGTESNQIWLNIAGNEVEVRLNGERLWQGTVPVSGQQVGTWAESFGQEADVDFQLLELYY